MATYDSVTDRTAVGEGPGGLIPQAQRREILQDMVQQSAVLQLGTRVNLSTRVEKQPVLAALPQAYWVSGDTGLKQTSAAEWENKTITAEELAVVIPVPENVLADSSYDIFAELRPRIVEAFGKKLDQAVLFGTDAPGSFEASLHEGAVAASQTHESGASVDLAEDINQVMALVEEDDYDVGGFAARKRLKARLRGLRTGDDALLFQPSLQAGTPGSLYGEPIFYSDANGAWQDEGVDLIGGDWSKLAVGVRQDLTYKVFTEGVISDEAGNVVLNLMQQDAVALRVVARYGFTVANPISSRTGDSVDRYPFAVLTTTEGS